MRVLWFLLALWTSFGVVPLTIMQIITAGDGLLQGAAAAMGCAAAVVPYVAVHALAEAFKVGNPARARGAGEEAN